MKCRKNTYDIPIHTVKLADNTLLTKPFAPICIILKSKHQNLSHIPCHSQFSNNRPNLKSRVLDVSHYLQSRKIFNPSPQQIIPLEKRKLHQTLPFPRQKIIKEEGQILASKPTMDDLIVDLETIMHWRNISVVSANINNQSVFFRKQIRGKASR